MTVTDLNGFVVKVTNLDEAILQAEAFKEFCQEDETFSDFDKKQRAYWTDLSEKLKTLKQEQYEQSSGQNGYQSLTDTCPNGKEF